MPGMVFEINVTSREIQSYPLPEKYRELGGRALTSTFIAENVPAGAHGLGPDNIIIFAPGILGGTGFICSGKLSVGSKSPLTKGIKEANCGGTAGTKLGRMGIAALVIKGAADDNPLSLLIVDEKGVRFEDAAKYHMMGNYALNEALRKVYEPRAAILSIGPAGEQKLLAASVASSDLDYHPSRQAARGGLGAVLGSKGIKAIVIDDSRIEKTKAHSANRKSLLEISRSLTKELVPKKAGLKKFGTAGGIATNNALGGMVTRNYREGAWDKVSNFDGEKIFNTITERHGKASVACMNSCPFRCSNYYVDKEGRHITSALEFETIILYGPNTLIDDIDTIAALDRIADDIGVDGIEMGVVLGLACENTDLMDFGDGKKACELLNEIGKGNLLGKIIGSGASTFAKIYGISRVPVAKDQALPAWDARALKGMGSTYCTSPMGGDHTAGPATQGRVGFVEEEVHIHNPKYQAQVSADLQTMIMVMDSMGLCFFVGPEQPYMEKYSLAIGYHLGIDFPIEKMIENARQSIKTEILYNDKCGVQRVDIPWFIQKEPIPPNNLVFDVPVDELHNAINSFLD